MSETGRSEEAARAELPSPRFGLAVIRGDRERELKDPGDVSTDHFPEGTRFRSPLGSEYDPANDPLDKDEPAT